MSFDPEQALDRVSEVFRQRGFEATSLQALLAASGLSKSSLYQQYGNKQRLFEQCLEHYGERIENEMRRGLEQAASGRDFIAAVLEQVISEAAPPGGCLIFNTASDLGQLDARVARRVNRFFVRFRAVLITALEQDQANGLLPEPVAARDLANVIMASIGGLRLLSKGGMQQAELRRSCALILTLLERPAHR